MTFKIKSVLQTHISYIAKRHFPKYLLWHCIKECMQETPYNFLIEVSLLCIILPSMQKSGYYVLLLFHPKVSFQCIIMPSKTKESLHYISILYIKKSLFFPNNLFRRNRLWKFARTVLVEWNFCNTSITQKESLPFFS